MSMRIRRLCKVCGEPFWAIKSTQFFGSRKCFKKSYYERTQNKLQDEERNPHYPIKKCVFCGESAMLSFDPLKNPELFNTWECPHCKVTNILIWKYQNKPNSHQTISGILTEITSQIVQNTTPQYHPYYLPVMRPEQGNDSIVVMTCDILNILDIQKKNRRKITFS